MHAEGPVSALRATGVSRLIPAPVAVAGAVAAGRVAWLHPRRRRAARRWAHAMAPGAGPAAAERLARRHLVERAAQEELFWRGGTPERIVLDGTEHLDAALAAGRGAIVAFPHVGPLTMAPIALAAHRGRAYIARRDVAQAGTVHGPDGRWIKTQRGFIENAGGRLLSRGGTFQSLLELLARGEVVLLAWDVAGRHPVEFLGRHVAVRGGVDALAAASGAPVLPAFVWRERWRARVHLSAAVSPDRDGRVVPPLAADADARLRPRLAQANDSLAVWLSGSPDSL